MEEADADAVRVAERYGRWPGVLHLAHLVAEIAEAHATADPARLRRAIAAVERELARQREEAALLAGDDEPAPVDLDLDRIFRKGSKAQHAAKILLEGQPISRPDLAARVGVSPTTVPRVIELLEREGVVFETTLGENGRTSVYRVVSPIASQQPDLMAALEASLAEARERAGAEGSQRTSTGSGEPERREASR